MTTIDRRGFLAALPALAAGLAVAPKRPIGQGLGVVAYSGERWYLAPSKMECVRHGDFELHYNGCPCPGPKIVWTETEIK